MPRVVTSAAEPRPHADFRCRACGSEGATPVLSLGETPLANALLEGGQLQQPEPRFPLDLVFCEACTLLQLTETVPPEQLFREYVYFSSFSDAAVDHARRLVGRVLEERRLGPGSLVLEIASNDGYLLQHYVARGVGVLGIEPARNIAAAATARGIDTLNEFFGADLAARLAASGRTADVIHANNVLAHVPDPNGFMAGISTVLRPHGTAIIEVPWVRELVRQVEFDTIYHEHLSYFSLHALDALARRHSLRVTDVEVVAIHGGSLRVWLGHATESAQTSRVDDLLALEKQEGIDRLTYYAHFSDAVQRLRTELRSLLRDLKAAGARIAAYGASAKGSTLLNYTGIGRETLDFIVDRSTVKQGRYTPGTQLRIHPPEHLLTEMPDYVLLLTWNFADEILAQQAEYRSRGGRFILPLPRPRVLES